MIDPATLPPLLLPTPARLDLLAGDRVSTTTTPVFYDDPSLPSEGYHLRVHEDSGVSIVAATPAGRLHGSRTLDQLRTQYPASIPALAIEDAPALATRGVMLDVSRCRVPTMNALLAQTDLLGSLKYNHMQLYIEHAFAYEGHEAVWAGSDPITPDELRRLDAHAASLAIELAANQNCFGHMTRWLSLPEYSHLAETHDEFDFYAVPRRGPFSLCPTDPASLVLIEDLLRQQVACVSSGLVNIGCDETADIGAGRSRDAVDRHGRHRVYLDYVGAVCEIAERLRARPMLWGDIALSGPEGARALPERAIALAWGYEPDSSFDDWGRSLAKSGRDWLACPGTSSWRSITGRTTERRQNLVAAVGAALRHGAEGILLTDWGDLGHRQQPPIALLAIGEGAQAAWNPAAAPDPRAVSLHVFGDRSLQVAQWLADLGDVDRQIRATSGIPGDLAAPTPLRNASALFELLHPSGAANALPRYPQAWTDVLDRLTDLRKSCPVEEGPLLAVQLANSLDVAEFSATLALHGLTETTDRAGDLHERLDEILESHERLWASDSRPGGLDESLSFYESLRERITRPTVA